MMGDRDSSSWMRSRLSSFGYAFEGLAIAFREMNFRIHIMATLLVLICGWWFDISRLEWMILAITTGMVLMGEAMNTAIELLADFVSPDVHPAIKRIKDVAAAGVLITALAALAIGMMIFLPYLM